MRTRPNRPEVVKYRVLLEGLMATAENAGRPHSGARPERKVSDLIYRHSAATPGCAKGSGGAAPGCARIRPGSAPGWKTVAAGSALGWAPGWGRLSLEFGSVPDKRAPSLGIRFLSAFPGAHVSASPAPMIAGLVPFGTVLGGGDAVAPLTRGVPYRT